MAITVRPIKLAVPTRANVVSRDGTATLAYTGFFEDVGRIMSRRTIVVDNAFDPASIPAGATLKTTISLTAAGIKAGSWAVASFSNLDDDVTISAAVTALNTIVVTFWNTSGGAIDMATGTLRVMVEIPE